MPKNLDFGDLIRRLDDQRTQQTNKQLSGVMQWMKAINQQTMQQEKVKASENEHINNIMYRLNQQYYDEISQLDIDNIRGDKWTGENLITLMQKIQEKKKENDELKKLESTLNLFQRNLPLAVAKGLGIKGGKITGLDKYSSDPEIALRQVEIEDQEKKKENDELKKLESRLNLFQRNLPLDVAKGLGIKGGKITGLDDYSSDPEIALRQVEIEDQIKRVELQLSEEGIKAKVGYDENKGVITVNDTPLAKYRARIYQKAQLESRLNSLQQILPEAVAKNLKIEKGKITGLGKYSSDPDIAKKQVEIENKIQNVKLQLAKSGIKAEVKYDENKGVITVNDTPLAEYLARINQEPQNKLETEPLPEKPDPPLMIRSNSYKGKFHGDIDPVLVNVAGNNLMYKEDTLLAFDDNLNDLNVESQLNYFGYNSLKGEDGLDYTKYIEQLDEVKDYKNKYTEYLNSAKKRLARDSKNMSKLLPDGEIGIDTIREHIFRNLSNEQINDKEKEKLVQVLYEYAKGNKGTEDISRIIKSWKINASSK